jgi:hypothetical protein
VILDDIDLETKTSSEILTRVLWSETDRATGRVVGGKTTRMRGARTPPMTGAADPRHPPGSQTPLGTGNFLPLDGE